MEDSNGEEIEPAFYRNGIGGVEYVFRGKDGDLRSSNLLDSGNEGFLLAPELVKKYEKIHDPSSTAQVLVKMGRAMESKIREILESETPVHGVTRETYNTVFEGFKL